MLFDACVDRCLALLTLRALKTREIHDGVTSVSRRITGHAGWVTLPTLYCTSQLAYLKYLSVSPLGEKLFNADILSELISLPVSL